MADYRDIFEKALDVPQARQSPQRVGPGATTKGDLMRIAKQRPRSPWKKGPSPAEAALKRTGIMQAPFPTMKQKFFGG